MSRATIDDVASLAGVSIKTVSRVVNREPNVRASTRERVEAAIASLSYRPNSSARNLASHRARLLMLIYDDPSSYETPSSGYITRMQEGVLRACRESGYELLIHPCNYRDRHIGRELREVVGQSRLTGTIVAAPLSNMQSIVQAIRKTGTPCVRLSTGNSKTSDYSVATNDREVSAEMTRYLASLGHRRIAFIQGDEGHKAVANRFLGYRDGLREAGLKYDNKLVVSGDNSIRSGEKCAGRLLDLPSRPSAIFAANDDMAAGVLRVAMRLGISVPEELSIAGCDDISLAQQLYPALTTIRQPLRAMAEAASRALIDAARGKPRKPKLEIVPATIQIRESTGPSGPLGK